VPIALKRRWYDRRVVLLAFLVALVVVLAALTFAVVRAIGLWRQTKRTGGALGGELASFEEKAALAERHMSEFERSSKDLEEALERLRVSRARLRVLVDAVERAQDRVRWIRVFVPR
jgi:exonuclease VII small subunit